MSNRSGARFKISSTTRAPAMPLPTTTSFGLFVFIYTERRAPALRESTACSRRADPEIGAPRRNHPDFPAANLHRIPRQRARRRPGQHAAVFGAEETFMARTVKPPLVVLIIHRTHQVRAALAVSGELAFAQADENARMVFGRITEQFGTADGDFIHGPDELRFHGPRRRLQSAFRHPAGADRERRAAGDFDKLPAGDFMLGGLPDRK